MTTEKPLLVDTRIKEFSASHPDHNGSEHQDTLALMLDARHRYRDYFEKREAQPFKPLKALGITSSPNPLVVSFDSDRSNSIQALSIVLSKKYSDNYDKAREEQLQAKARSITLDQVIHDFLRIYQSTEEEKKQQLDAAKGEYVGKVEKQQKNVDDYIAKLGKMKDVNVKLVDLPYKKILYLINKLELIMSPLMTAASFDQETAAAKKDQAQDTIDLLKTALTIVITSKKDDMSKPLASPKKLDRLEKTVKETSKKGAMLKSKGAVYIEIGRAAHSIAKLQEEYIDIGEASAAAYKAFTEGIDNVEYFSRRNILNWDAVFTHGLKLVMQYKTTITSQSETEQISKETANEMDKWLRRGLSTPLIKLADLLEKQGQKTGNFGHYKAALTAVDPSDTPARKQPKCISLRGTDNTSTVRALRFEEPDLLEQTRTSSPSHLSKSKSQSHIETDPTATSKKPQEPGILKRSISSFLGPKAGFPKKKPPAEQTAETGTTNPMASVIGEFHKRLQAQSNQPAGEIGK